MVATNDSTKDCVITMGFKNNRYLFYDFLHKKCLFVKDNSVLLFCGNMNSLGIMFFFL